MTGIGNLAAFGAALLGPSTEWGATLALKLGLVLLLVVLSLPRTLAVARISVSLERTRPRSITALRNLYAATTAGVRGDPRARGLARARSGGMSLITWSLATFHAALFVLVIVLFGYRGGGLGGALGGLNTFVGLGLFVALWATTYLTTSRALKGLDLIGSARDRRAYPRRAFRWGAANGMSFLVVLGIVAVADRGREYATRPGDVGDPAPGPRSSRRSRWSSPRLSAASWACSSGSSISDSSRSPVSARRKRSKRSSPRGRNPRARCGSRSGRA